MRRLMNGRGLWVLGVALALAGCPEVEDDPADNDGSPGAGGGGGAGGGMGAAPDDFVAFEPGEFTMGSPEEEPDRQGDEGQRRVTIAHGFWLQRTEVTRAQWQGLVGNQPWSSGCEDDACPVESVSWFEAAAFANARSVAEGLPECYRLADCNGSLPGEGYECATAEAVGVACGGYRLPTEAEWEYAARSGGQAQRFTWGDAPATCERAVMDDPNQGGRGCGTDGTLSVCSRPEGNTAQGLCDMAGNVWEWVEDWYGPYAEAPVDGSARHQAARHRVLRGGSWYFTAGSLRAAFRRRNHPGLRYSVLGFRLARSTP